VAGVNRVKLSILIPTLPSRLAMFTRLMSVLEPQLTPDVELLWLGDNKTRILGDKRNDLLSLATGDYVAFCDDDDLVEASYVQEVLAATESKPDVITFDQVVTRGGKRPKLCKYGIHLNYTETPGLWTGKPAHTHPYRREIAQSCKFPSKLFGEDFDYVAQAWPQCKTEHRIEKVLYRYLFDKRTSETRNRVN
jgi:glycosyltransferase involved in cell wall biosynthesis